MTLQNLKAERLILKGKINARAGQPGYAANVSALNDKLTDLDTQIAELEAELAAQAQEEADAGVEQPQA